LDFLKYREATPADSESIAALHARSWQVNYRGAFPDSYLDGDALDERRAVWADRFAAAPDNQFVVLCEDDGGELLGFACAFGEADERWGTLLDNLHVRPGMNGQGIGKRLVRRVAAWHLAKYPERPMYLWVLEQNQRGQRFYERLGGTREDTVAFDTPGGGQSTGIRYAWSGDALRALAEGVAE